jgi:hypothetical protein
MKITRNQLRQIILESLLEQTSEEDSSKEDINITMDVPERKGFSFTFKAVGNKVDAFFEDESGKIKKIEKTKEDEEKLLGVLRAALDTAKDKTQHLVIKAIARLTGESEKEEDLISVGAKIKNDRTLSSYATLIKDPKSNLV